MASESAKLKITANIPHCCDSCSGKLYYIGAGAFECRKCQKTILTDYGKVRKYIEENGMTSILELEHETGVDRQVLEQFEKEGTLYDPYEDINRCYSCGCVIEKGRYCKECQQNLMGRLAEALKSEDGFADDKPQKVSKKNNRMHYLKKN